MRNLNVLCGVLLVAVAAVACDSDDSSGSGAVDMSAYITKCKAVCTQQSGADCLDYDTVEECQADCDDAKSYSGQCAADLKAAGDCVEAKAKTDVCTAEEKCSSEFMKALASCGAPK